MVRSAGVLTGLALSSLALADDGISDTAPSMLAYAGIGEDCCGEDPHPVHGVPTADGGYVVCGKAIDAGGQWEGFVTKVGPGLTPGVSFLGPDEAQSWDWSLTFGSRGARDGANQVASLPDAVLMAGFRTTGGDMDRYLTKLDLATGGLIWELTLPSRNSSAFEAIEVTADGGLIAVGVADAPNRSIEGFKSYGNPTGGEAFVMYFSPDQLAGDEAPAGPVWERSYAPAVSMKGVREVPEEGGYVLAATDEDERAMFIRIDEAGEVLHSRVLAAHGEATDIAVLQLDGSPTGAVISGHRGGDAGGIDGAVTHISLDGEVTWTRTYGDLPGGIGPFAGLDGGNPVLIFDECWGIRATADGGAVLACGTGIEGCGMYAPGTALSDECRADPRRIWRGLVIGLDGDGEVLWHRLDSFLFPGEYDAGDAASEYVMVTEGGEVVSVVDQGFGIGLLVLESPDDAPPLEDDDPTTTDGSTTDDDPTDDGTTDAGSGGDSTWDDETGSPGTSTGSDAPAGSDDADGSRGSGTCASVSGSPWPWSLLVLLLVRRRRQSD